MAWREWPLVAFTLLGQFAVGFFMFGALPRLLGPASAERLSGRLASLAIVFAAGALAAAVSFFHLARPWRAPRALANLRTSWLSREILFELLFLAAVGGSALLILAGRGDGWTLRAGTYASTAFGAAYIASMARLYMVPGVRAWNGVATPAGFVLSTVLLGAFGAAAARTVDAGAGPGPAGFAGPAAALLAGAVVVHLFFTPGSGVRGYRETPTLRPRVKPSPRFFAARLALLAGSGLTLLPLLAAGAGAWRGPVAAAVWLALGLVAASEVIGRFQFYAWGVRPGPGF